MRVLRVFTCLCYATKRLALINWPCHLLNIASWSLSKASDSQWSHSKLLIHENADNKLIILARSSIIYFQSLHWSFLAGKKCIKSQCAQCTTARDTLLYYFLILQHLNTIVCVLLRFFLFKTVTMKNVLHKKRWPVKCFALYTLYTLYTLYRECHSMGYILTFLFLLFLFVWKLSCLADTIEWQVQHIHDMYDICVAQ